MRCFTSPQPGRAITEDLRCAALSLPNEFTWNFHIIFDLLEIMRKNVLLLLTVLALSLNTSSFAEENSSPPKPTETQATQSEPASKKPEQTPVQDQNSLIPDRLIPRGYAKDGTASLIYSPIDLLIPSKIGASIGYRFGETNVFELEYLRGTIAIPFLVDDIGSFKEEKLSLLVRSFSDRSSSFNFFYGVAMVRTRLEIGNEILSRVSGSIPAGYDVANFLSIAPVVGIGNRWKWDNGVTFTIDWASLTQPVVVVKDELPIFDSVTNAEDKDDLDTFKKIVSYFPRLTLFKLELGFSF